MNTSRKSAQILAAGKKTLRAAANALNSLEQDLDGDFARAVALLQSCKRLVITTGIGKSGHIARKIAATLTSTGTASIFLDPMNALHGDLGIVAPGDVLIAISFSGETKELLELAPTLRQRTIPIIAIVGKLGSTLESIAKVCLFGRIEREACPLNLAPTTSTTLALALGDALAVGLMVAKDYQAEDFALNHPAGSLGRRLTLHVGDLLRDAADTHCIRPDVTFIDTVCAISKSGVGAVCIVDQGRRVLGIVTDGDVRRTVQNHPLGELATLRAMDIMTQKPVVTRLDTLAVEALHAMEQRPSQISVLPVVDIDNIFHGILRVHDLVQAGV